MVELNLACSSNGFPSFEELESDSDATFKDSISVFKAMEDIIVEQTEEITKLKKQLEEQEVLFQKVKSVGEVSGKKLLEEQNLNMRLTKENQKLSENSLCVQNLKTVKNLFKYYSGLESYEVFRALLDFLVPDGNPSCINYSCITASYLPLEEQFLVALMKLRHNFGFKDLAFRFGKSEMGMSRLFKSWINFMYLRFGSLSMWPHRDVLIANSPEDFRKNFPNVMVVLDGTEIYLEKPSDLIMQRQTYSTYKSANTFKGLIGVDQRGAIIFISHLMDGSVSDKELVEQSKLLELIKKKLEIGHLLPSDELMADKGFTIRDLLTNVGINLVIPPFASSTEQMSAENVLKTKQIAKFRVHVERAMARIKKFKIVSHIIPMSMVGSINQIWSVVCVLANAQFPLRS